MNCDQVAREIDAYLDGELSAAEAEQLAGHVARCSDCSARFGPLLRTVRMLQTMPELRAPRELLPVVLSHVPERSAARMGWTLGLTGAAASAAIVFGLICLVGQLPTWLGALGAGGRFLGGMLARAVLSGVEILTMVAGACQGPLMWVLLINFALLGAGLLLLAVCRRRPTPTAVLSTF